MSTTLITNQKTMENVIEKYRELMDKHGLQHWTCAFSTKKSRIYGTCHYSQRKLTINPLYNDIASDSDIIDTILHEIAHALDYERYGNVGHGKTWKSVCREIGAIPRASGKSYELKPYKYHLIVEETGEFVCGYYRRPRIDLRYTFVKGRKEETFGKLAVVAL
jgi:predicted SprT family Zn-dependent metalloprotease